MGNYLPCRPMAASLLCIQNKPTCKAMCNKKVTCLKNRLHYQSLGRFDWRVIAQKNIIKKLRATGSLQTNLIHRELACGKFFCQHFKKIASQNAKVLKCNPNFWTLVLNWKNCESSIKTKMLSLVSVCLANFKLWAIICHAGQWQLHCCAFKISLLVKPCVIVRLLV